MSDFIKSRSGLSEIAKGGFLATLLSILFVLFFALFARIFEVSASIIPVANTIIKILSVAIAVFLCIKSEKNGFVKGIGIGIGFTLLSNVVFCLLGGGLNFQSVLIDVVILSVVGFIAGAIAVNRKK